MIVCVPPVVPTPLTEMHWFKWFTVILQQKWKCDFLKQLPKIYSWTHQQLWYTRQKNAYNNIYLKWNKGTVVCTENNWWLKITKSWKKLDGIKGWTKTLVTVFIHTHTYFFSKTNPFDEIWYAGKRKRWGSNSSSSLTLIIIYVISN